MIRRATPAILACLALTLSSALAGGPRKTAIERYGIGGHVQAVGLHHGFHVEMVVPDSSASEDRIKTGDVILKVDGENVRSIEQLRAVFAEACLDDGQITITYSREDSIVSHTLECHLKPAGDKPAGDKPAAKKRRPREDDDR